MKSFQEILTKKFGSKKFYAIENILIAHKDFLSQKDKKNDVKFARDKPKDKYLFRLNLPSHKWNGRLVSTTMKQVKDGWVVIRHGSQIDHVKPRFLVKA